MTVKLLNEGTLKAEFLTCRRPCENNCDDDSCFNEKKEIRLLEQVIFQLPDQRMPATDHTVRTHTVNNDQNNFFHFRSLAGYSGQDH